MAKIKEIIEWFFAFVIAFLIINFCCFVYNRNPGWIDRNEGSTTGIWYPNKYIVHGTEGYSVYKSDKNGYLNDDKELDDGYILALGSSYTAGKEVVKGYRYSDILNKKMSSSNHKLKVYNLSEDGQYFTGIVKGFDSIIKEFDKSSTIIIEIATTEFSNEDLEQAMNYRQYNENQTGSKILDNLDFKQKLKLEIKNYFPLISNLSRQYKMYKNKNKIVNDNKKIDFDLYKKDLNKIFSHIKENYSGNIIILYHPNISLSKNGKMKISSKKTDGIFKESCEENNIVFLDMSEIFIKKYNEDYTVPYGFFNTSIANGHLNYQGHREIANELYRIIKEEDK